MDVKFSPDGKQLACRPTRPESAERTAAVLKGLFREHGPRLVLRRDNGSAFRAEQLQKLLVMGSVLLLHSPGYNSSGNVSAEVGVGSIKVWTEESAERATHRGLWTLEAAEG